ncbi:MICOS complex subunit MIC26-like [Limanda limanda]|uniref:MICOS complex subunit MIC26-like n=1 Tax=Limanda limanda TaxID=27771 RepID=UPI0029C932F3|nr:MICOS complex subunit MIC26-like [Limanda limanda]
MLKVTGSGVGSGVMPGTVALLPGTLHAAAGDGEQEPASCSVLNRDELSLYADPPQSPGYEEPEPGQLEQSLASFRKLLEPSADWWQGTYSTIQPRVHSVFQGGQDAYSYLDDPPKGFYPRAGVIGLTGVLGLLLARGSRARRLLYPAGLVTLSTSLYYPERAASIARAAGDSVYDRAVQGYAAVERMVKPQSEAAKAADSDPKPR